MADSLHKFELAPFEERPKRGAIFRNEEYAHVWGDLQDALMRYTGVLVLTGEEGSGRSTILEDMVDQYPMGNLRVFWQSAADYQKGGVAENLAQALGVRPGSKEPADIYAAVLDELDQNWSQRKCVVLVISQAELLGLDGLQDLQSLLNFRHSHIEGLQVYLTGTPKLNDMLQVPELAVLNCQIVSFCHLDPMTLDDTRRFIHHNLKISGWTGEPALPEESVSLIHKLGCGLPGRTSLLCRELFALGNREKLEILKPQHISGVAARLEPMPAVARIDQKKPRVSEDKDNPFLGNMDLGGKRYPQASTAQRRESVAAGSEREEQPQSPKPIEPLPEIVPEAPAPGLRPEPRGRARRGGGRSALVAITVLVVGLLLGYLVRDIGVDFQLPSYFQEIRQFAQDRGLIPREPSAETAPVAAEPAADALSSPAVSPAQFEPRGEESPPNQPQAQLWGDAGNEESSGSLASEAVATPAESSLPLEGSPETGSIAGFEEAPAEIVEINQEPPPGESALYAEDYDQPADNEDSTVDAPYEAVQAESEAEPIFNAQVSPAVGDSTSDPGGESTVGSGYLDRGVSLAGGERVVSQELEAAIVSRVETASRLEDGSVLIHLQAPHPGMSQIDRYLLYDSLESLAFVLRNFQGVNTRIYGPVDLGSSSDEGVDSVEQVLYFVKEQLARYGVPRESVDVSVVPGAPGHSIEPGSGMVQLRVMPR